MDTKVIIPFGWLSKDGKLLLSARIVRTFAYGFLSVILANISKVNWMALIASAFIGTINVTGTETGAFLSIEQAMLPQTISDTKKRNTIYALYNMVGTFAMSAGILLSGFPSVLELRYGLNQIQSIRPHFLL